MSDEGGRHDAVQYYGPFAWIAGFALGIGVIVLMFTLADGFN